MRSPPCGRSIVSARLISDWVRSVQAISALIPVNAVAYQSCGISS